MDPLHLQRTSLVADIGAGTGYFSVWIAKRIPEGKIFAADIEPDMVRYLGERARLEHLTRGDRKDAATIKGAGYTLVDTLQFLPRQYCLVFDKGNS